MGYLIAEILICLILAAIIGAVIAWLLRGARCRSIEGRLSTELDQAHGALETAEANGRALEQSLTDLRAEMDSETRNLQAKIETLEIENGKLQDTVKELEPLEGKIKERDVIIGHWERDFEHLKQESESEVAQLQENIAGLAPLQAELETSQQACARLKSELQELQSVAGQADQKTQQISNLQNEIERLQSVSAEIKERDTAIERLQSQLRAQAKAKDEEIAHLQNKLQAKHRSRLEQIEALSARLSKVEHLPQVLAEREQQISRLQDQLDKAAQQKNRELSALKAELKRREATIEDLRKQLAAGISRAKPAAAPARSVKRPPKKQLYTPPKEKDDLKQIHGIGPVMERTLNKLGITTFEQVARFTPNDIERVAEALQSFSGRIKRDNWVGGAKKEYRKKYGKKI